MYKMSVETLLHHFDFIHDYVDIWNEQTKEQFRYDLRSHGAYYRFMQEFGERKVREWSCMEPKSIEIDLY